MDKLVNYSIWTLSHDCFQGFIKIEESQQRTSSMPSLWEIKIYSCANDYWSTLHTSSCIENMDNLVNYSIWTLSHDCFKGFFFKIEESQEINSSMPSLCEIKIYSCENVYQLTLHTSSCMENMTCLGVKLGFILVKLNVVYERDIVVGIS